MTLEEQIREQELKAGGTIFGCLTGLLTAYCVGQDQLTVSSVAAGLIVGYVSKLGMELVGEVTRDSIYFLSRKYVQRRYEYYLDSKDKGKEA